MDEGFQRLLKAKTAERREHVDAADEEKLKTVERLRNRSETLKGKRRSIVAEETPIRFGGRASAEGVNYECQIASYIAVKMLCGSVGCLFEGVNGDQISSILLQAPEPVDDIVLELAGGGLIYLSAKYRRNPIALSPNNSAFVETVRAFVQQFLKIPQEAIKTSRLVLGVPASAGSKLVDDLRRALDAHRKDSGDDSLSHFFNRRPYGERSAFEKLLSQTEAAWKAITNENSTDCDLRSFLRLIYIELFDFETDGRMDLEAQENLRAHVAMNTDDAQIIWQTLNRIFQSADRLGTRVTAASLRVELEKMGLRIKGSATEGADTAGLRRLTQANLARLEEHRTLAFGQEANERVHIARAEDLCALLEAVKERSILITGEPGAGKSGLVCDLVKTLETGGVPIVLLLAEDGLPEFSKPLIEILPSVGKNTWGAFVTDALDSARDPGEEKKIRNFFEDLRRSAPSWRIVASVREFDLKHNTRLRDLFPGEGTAGYSCSEFSGVAHFHVPRFTETQLDVLAGERTEIRPFLEGARNNSQSGGIHRSPFHLRLAAELLRAGVSPIRLADWNSPALLMRKFWQLRVLEGEGGAERTQTLRTITRTMVEARRMVVSQKLLPDGSSALIAQLRSRGVIEAPKLHAGTEVATDTIRFSHHLIHDYAIARSLIPENPDDFCTFVATTPLLAIFYRQSFTFAMEETWDASFDRRDFWTVVTRLEAAPKVYGISRILGPAVAARRTERVDDLLPLLDKIRFSQSGDSPESKALKHLIAGLQDTEETFIVNGREAWCELAEQLSRHLPSMVWVEDPLVHLLARLKMSITKFSNGNLRLLNTAGCKTLLHHARKKVEKSWPYAGLRAIECVCATFKQNAAESEIALLSLLHPDRLASFPHNDLSVLADNLGPLGEGGTKVALRLFEAAFGSEPQPGQWNQMGTAIMPMRIQSSDEWHLVRYRLADFYEHTLLEDPDLMTQAVCIAWNSVVRRRNERREGGDHLLGTVKFRGVWCDLIQDYSHIWGRQFENDENRILTRYEALMRTWASNDEQKKLNEALDAFAKRNQGSLLWSILMELGAEYPKTLGGLLEPLLSHPIFLTHPDYSYGAIELFVALHRTSEALERERLEQLILDLPGAAILRNETLYPTPAVLMRSQAKILGRIVTEDLLSPILVALQRELRDEGPFPANSKHKAPVVEFRDVSAEEAIEDKGIDLTDEINAYLFKLRQKLDHLRRDPDKELSEAECDSQWHLILESRDAAVTHSGDHPEMAKDLWGYVVGACESLVRKSQWPNNDSRWGLLREVLLVASNDSVPSPSDESEDDDWPSWGWPAPRIDAAQGLCWLSFRLERTDEAIEAALLRLQSDPARTVRFNLASNVHALEQAAPELLLRMVDGFLAQETSLAVLDVLLRTLNSRPCDCMEQLLPKLGQLSERAIHGIKSRLLETLTQIFLFHYLRTGDAQSQTIIRDYISRCDEKRFADALIPQLHSCRVGGWLIAGNPTEYDPKADAARSRTWTFLLELLQTAQSKLRKHRTSWETGAKEGTDVSAAKEGTEHALHVLDAIAGQLYFGSGAFAAKNEKDEKNLSPSQLRRYWDDSQPLFKALAEEIHPHVCHQLIETFHHLLEVAPRDVFKLAARAIRSGSEGGYHLDHLAVEDVVRFIQRALAEYRELFQGDEDCLDALLMILDLFVEAGWAEARKLTFRLEEIYR